MKNKDYNHLVGTGVAIMCSDQCVRKYLIAAVRTEFGCDGSKLLGVRLNAPRYEQEYLKNCGWATEDADSRLIWIKPEICHRNKGECFRVEMKERIDEFERRIESLKSERRKAEGALEEAKKRLDFLDEKILDEQDDMDEFLNKMKKSKVRGILTQMEEA